MEAEERHSYSVEFQRFNKFNVKHGHMTNLDATSYRDVWDKGDGGERENICEMSLKLDSLKSTCTLLLNTYEPFIYASRFVSEHRH